MPRVASRQSASRFCGCWSVCVGVCGLVDVSWWSKQCQRDFTALLLYVFRVKQQLLTHGHWNVRVLTVTCLLF